MPSPEDDMAQHAARLEHAIARVRSKVHTLTGEERFDLEMVLAAAHYNFIDGWKGPRFDTLKRFAEGDGYLLKAGDRLLQEPSHISRKSKEYSDAADKP